jgi:hypothetical protein
MSSDAITDDDDADVVADAKHRGGHKPQRTAAHDVAPDIVSSLSIDGHCRTVRRPRTLMQAMARTSNTGNGSEWGDVLSGNNWQSMNDMQQLTLEERYTTNGNRQTMNEMQLAATGDNYQRKPSAWACA